MQRSHKGKRAELSEFSTPWRFIDEIEAARLLGVSRKVMQNWRWQGRGPAFFRIESCIRYEVGELWSYAAERRAQSLAEADRHDAERRRAMAPEGPGSD
jgi:hypothetical protein